MRLGKAAVFGVVTGTMTIGLAAPAMAETGDVVVKPGKARPGDKVTVSSTKCDRDGTAGSLAFENGSVPLDGAEEVDGRAGLATIKSDTTPGTYTVLVRCGKFRAVGQFDVVEGKAGSKPHTAPKGGAKTGIGGGAGDSGTVLLAGGLVLLLGAGGIGAVAVRRRNDAAA
ncbi:hypothetical protein [Actinomadura rugatobispora]|uniref:LPXTG cell wall anchor domain-containing protein n=1 Tax=Actinomadura rugatobispora TaxID=1994 RepID=A0ABW0ZYD4_9ACTN|nr:hypothetical protein GCM10010200_091170 [Actinomadura rugatobispora]